MANVLISGTSSGIGLATALELARAGHRVFATLRNPATAPELAATAENERLPIDIRTLDVDSDESVRNCFEAISEPLDVLVNNAGRESHGSVEEVPLDEFRAVMATNYFGAVRCMKAVLPRMREARRGCIINVSSVAGRIAIAPLGPYSASKFALEAISEALAGEVNPYNIRVAIVEPGIQDTKMARAIEQPPVSMYPHARWRAAVNSRWRASRLPRRFASRRRAGPARDGQRDRARRHRQAAPPPRAQSNHSSLASKAGTGMLIIFSVPMARWRQPGLM